MFFFCFFYGEIWLIIPKLPVLPLLIWSTAVNNITGVFSEINTVSFLKISIQSTLDISKLKVVSNY